MRLYTILMLYSLCFIPMLVILPIFPYLTRKTLSFGISIPEELFNSPDIKAIRERYRNRTFVSVTAIALVVLVLLFNLASETGIVAIIAGTFAQLIPVNIFYLQSHFKMKALKKNSDWNKNKSQIVVVDTDFRKKKTTLSSLWFLLYAGIILATLFIGIAVYDELPDKIPAHYDINGNVDRWTEKSYAIIFSIPVVQIFIGILMAFVYIIIRKSKQQIDAANPEKSIEQNRIFRYRWSAFAVFSGAGLLLMFSFIQFARFGLLPLNLVLPLTLVIPLLMLAAVVVLAVTTGQSGSRISEVHIKSKDGKTDRVISRDDDKYWKLGVFYYNPDDPTIFVEKRFGIGWDFNWERPASWLILLGLLAVPALIAILAFALEK